RHHAWTRRQRFPASVKSAHARWARWIDDVVSNFWMCVIRAAIKNTVENNSPANSGSNRDVNQALLVFPCTPVCFRQSRGISIVFERNRNLEYASKIPNGIFPFPCGKEVHKSDLASQRINGTSAPNSDARNFCLWEACGFAQHCGGPFEGTRVSTSCIGWSL